MSPVKELIIDPKTCGNWIPEYIIDILKKYPQTNFQEWELLQMHHANEPKKVAINMVSKFWFPHSDPWGRKCAIGQLEINRTLQRMETN